MKENSLNNRTGTDILLLNEISFVIWIGGIVSVTTTDLISHDGNTKMLA